MPLFASDTVSTSLPEWYSCKVASDCAKVDFCGCGGIPVANKKHLRKASGYNHYMAKVSNCAPVLNPTKLGARTIACQKNICTFELEPETKKK